MQFPSMNVETGRLSRTLIVVLSAGMLFSGCSKPGEAESTPTVTVQVDAAEKGPIQLKLSPTQFYIRRIRRRLCRKSLRP